MRIGTQARYLSSLGKGESRSSRLPLLLAGVQVPRVVVVNDLLVREPPGLPVGVTVSLQLNSSLLHALFVELIPCPAHYSLPCS